MKFLIIGLGNVGSEYHNTRHNIGFSILDHFASEFSFSFNEEKYGFYASLRYKSRALHFLKPSLFMNNSGKSVKFWKQKLKINFENLLVITDDLALDFSKTRLKARGSDGGHNGLKSINNYLSSCMYPRLRVGIGNDFKRGNQSNYVLEKFSDFETSEIKFIKEKCQKIVDCYVTQGISSAMNNFN
tara:strand:+ start:2340 stop:2897 length:558 start_codon:yes stop_codon:yes gene_type:complete